MRTPGSQRGVGAGESLTFIGLRILHHYKPSHFSISLSLWCGRCSGQQNAPMIFHFG